jgi:hypothetical protein
MHKIISVLITGMIAIPAHAESRCGWTLSVAKEPGGRICDLVL